MVTKFNLILEDLKQREINYKLYIPENFSGYADSQTKAIIDILKIQIKGINSDFLIPPTALNSNFRRSNFSKLEKQIISYSSYSQSNSREETAENLSIFEDKKDQIISYLMQSYTAFYQKSKN